MAWGVGVASLGCIKYEMYKLRLVGVLYMVKEPSSKLLIVVHTDPDCRYMVLSRLCCVEQDLCCSVVVCLQPEQCVKAGGYYDAAGDTLTHNRNCFTIATIRRGN